MTEPPIEPLNISRRSFSRSSLGLFGWLATKSLASEPVAHGPRLVNNPTTASGSSIETGNSGFAIRYLRSSAPAFEIPPYTGTHYTDQIPDTLDICESAKLGVQVLTSITDPRANYEIFWGANFDQNPPVMFHDYNDWVQNCEGFMEALPLLRIATGSSLNSQVDPAWMTGILRSLGPDGLFYVPLGDCPWAKLRPPLTYVSPVWSSDGQKHAMSEASVTQVATPVTCERIISTMTVYYLRDKSPIWKEAIERMVDRLAASAIYKDDYAYMPAGAVQPGAKFGPDSMPIGFMAEETSARLIQGIAQYYRVSGYEPARDLAGKLTRYMRYHAQYYDPQGTPLVGPDERVWFHWYNTYAENDTIRNLREGGHGHAHGIGLLSILDYAAAVNSTDNLAFVRTGFEWMKANGSALVGYFPEIFIPGYDRSETCINADMIAMALKLTEAGVGDYWDDADRWTRNHFLGCQLTDPAWVRRMGSRFPAKSTGSNESTDRVPERNVGAFAGWSTGNDWVVPTSRHKYSIQHCCTGQASRAMYYIWQRMLSFEDETLFINLLMNRASSWCDVYSYIPFEGRVDLKIKTACKRVCVRMPEWVLSESPEVKCTKNDGLNVPKWNGRYVMLGPVRETDKISIRFPISERTVRENIGGIAYTLAVRGNTVISIDPPGTNGPLYERDYYRGPVRWRTVDRFIPNQMISW